MFDERFTPPRADLRGGSQSEDSFAISRSIFTPSVTLCLFARNSEVVKGLTTRKVLTHLHRLCSELLPEALKSVGSRFPDISFSPSILRCGREMGGRCQTLRHETRYDQVSRELASIFADRFIRLYAQMPRRWNWKTWAQGVIGTGVWSLEC